MSALVFFVKEPSSPTLKGACASAKVSATAATGPTAVSLNDPPGVTVALHAVQEDEKLTFAAGGVSIEPKKQSTLE